MTRLEGNSRRDVASLLVQYPASSRPSMLGITGVVPTARMSAAVSRVLGFSPSPPAPGPAPRGGGGGPPPRFTPPPPRGRGPPRGVGRPGAPPRGGVEERL